MSEQQQTLTIQEALDLALQHHTAGRLSDAENIYQQILQSHPDQPHALHLLGTIAHQMGKNNVAVDRITKALIIKPDYAEAHSNLGVVLQELGKPEEAVASHRKALDLQPDFAEAHNNLGLSLWALGKLEEAVASCRKALDIKPDYAEAHNNQGNALKDLGKLEEAVASYHEALAIKSDYFEAHYNLGNALKDQGKVDEAVVSYRKALTIEPDYVEAHNNLGVALQDLGRQEEAVASYHKALAIKSDYAEAHNNLGNSLRELGKLDEATASYRRALVIKPDYAAAYSNLGAALQDLGELDEAVDNCHKALAIQPDYVEAHYNLCEALEKTNNTEALREAVSRARRNCPESPLLALREAQILKRDGDYIAARSVLEASGEVLLDAHILKDRAYLLGDLCDRLGDGETAYYYFREGNRLTKNTSGARRADGNRFLARIDNLAKRFTSNWIAGWQDLENSDGRSAPVFLVGFPRSGTTLLDSILRSHPAITVVEEKPVVQNVQNALERLPGGYPDGLAKLNPTNLTELRQIYYAELDKHLEPEDRSAIVIDKFPLNTISAGLIHRIFPEARFVFAQRHPCDCVLSCYMQNFELNDAMANFLDLEDSARLYDKVMDLWQQYQSVLPLAVHTVRYESLIDTFEETVASVLDFLGVDWDDAVMNYAETGSQRGKINTPSYNQVTKPIYTRARGRWERFREHMEPVLPTLLPWANRFGYDE